LLEVGTQIGGRCLRRHDKTSIGRCRDRQAGRVY
jgi:hypothetical protein